MSHWAEKLWYLDLSATIALAPRFKVRNWED
jgi:hypothetical protein